MSPQPEFSSDRQAINSTNIKLDALTESVGEMKTVLREMTTAITRLAIFEERQTQASDAMARAFTALEKLEGRVATLEASAPVSKKTNDLVNKVMWAGVAVLAIFVLRKAGVLI